VQRANGLVEFVGDGGMPIGLIDDAEFGQMELELAPGDRLLLYSDGFTEQTNPDGQMLDEDGLSQLALEYTDTQGGEFIDALVWSLSAHSGNTDFDDDLSGVLLEYTGEELTEKS
jgi:sigma-B regulation protein RsbU (phosphoserine phosphatase)